MLPQDELLGYLTVCKAMKIAVCNSATLWREVNKPSSVPKSALRFLQKIKMNSTFVIGKKYMKSIAHVSHVVGGQIQNGAISALARWTSWKAINTWSIPCIPTLESLQVSSPNYTIYMELPQGLKSLIIDAKGRTKCIRILTLPISLKKLEIKYIGRITEARTSDVIANLITVNASTLEEITLEFDLADCIKTALLQCRQLVTFSWCGEQFSNRGSMQKIFMPRLGPRLKHLEIELWLDNEILSAMFASCRVLETLVILYFDSGTEHQAHDAYFGKNKPSISFKARKYIMY
jgi:hypothetical protein